MEKESIKGMTWWVWEN